ncbi:MAG: hypothetical protein ACJ790_06110 [Myxococcaceae bacterium]
MLLLVAAAPRSSRHSGGRDAGVDAGASVTSSDAGVASKTDAGTSRVRDGGVSPKLLGHGEVCAYGRRHPQSLQGQSPGECGEGLFCCYPCGVDGCDSVCHTKTECDEDMTRP